MTNQVLTPLEVETLLTAMVAGEASPDGDSPAKVFPLIHGEKVTPYDFKRPEHAGKEQMRALRTLHEDVGQNVAAALSALLRSTVEVKLAGVDLWTYGKFIAGLENPGCLNVLKAEPLDGKLLLDVSPSILYPIIDRLLGGGRETAALARRPFTEIELRLVSRITGLFLEELRRAWENVLDLKFAVLQVHGDPHLASIVGPSETVAVIRFELSIGDLRGTVKFCIPRKSIERIGGRLSAQNWISHGRKNSSRQTVQQISETICSSPVGVQVRLAQTKIGAGELMSLRVGDIITTQKDVHQPVIVSVEGVPKFRAKLGAFKGHKAILIASAIENPVDALGQ